MFCPSFQGRLYGRLDVIKSMSVRVDSLIATSPVRSFARSAGVMRVARCGMPTSQTGAEILLTNNEIYGEPLQGGLEGSRKRREGGE